MMLHVQNPLDTRGMAERAGWFRRPVTPAGTAGQGKLSDLLQVMGVGADERPAGEACSVQRTCPPASER